LCSLGSRGMLRRHNKSAFRTKRFLVQRESEFSAIRL
jgi:hypothetical protein